MSTPRTLIGLAVGSGFESVEAIALRTAGLGLAMTASVAGSARVPLPAELRETIRLNRPADVERQLADALVIGARQAGTKAGLDSRGAMAIGLLLPRSDSPADRVAEQTGLTVVAGFAGRDVAAGGMGRPLTPVADYLLFHDQSIERLLIHLGSVSSALLLPGGGKITDLAGFEAGPGNRLLDDIISLGTRGREAFDLGGRKAVQGRCLDELLARWLAHPYLVRPAPKTVPPGSFADKFVAEGFEVAQQVGASLNDLLCTATHFIAGCIGEGVRRWLPAARPGAVRRVAVSGGGVRNGFLWKLLEQQFPSLTVERLDELGVPALRRGAASAAILAGLTLDGVAGNLPLLTGAVGGRLLGRVIPGDARNWAACSAWMARQMADYLTLGRAA